MYPLFKRGTDISISILALFVLIPFFLIISTVIKISDAKGPVFYLGKRAAYKNKYFFLIKFRTMVHNAEQLGGPSTAHDDPRFTSIGRFLRKYKIDEIPQFFNILRGDMSLVGPRPQVLFYTDQYSNLEKKILSVRPGLTDLATIKFSDMDKILGSGDVDKKYSEEVEPLKNKLRLEYVNNMSFLLDMKIIILTILKILRIKHINN